MKKKEHKDCMSALLPVRDTLDVIGGKWKLLILISIWEGNKHFREIERSIPRLSMYQSFVKGIERYGSKSVDYKDCFKWFSCPNRI